MNCRCFLGGSNLGLFVVVESPLLIPAPVPAERKKRTLMIVTAIIPMCDNIAKNSLQ